MVTGNEKKSSPLVLVLGSVHTRHDIFLDIHAHHHEMPSWSQGDHHHKKVVISPPAVVVETDIMTTSMDPHAVRHPAQNYASAGESPSLDRDYLQIPPPHGPAPVTATAAGLAAATGSPATAIILPSANRFRALIFPFASASPVPSHQLVPLGTRLGGARAWVTGVLLEGLRAALQSRTPRPPRPLAGTSVFTQGEISSSQQREN
ncbi:hypothetical protein PR202_gb24271 [Eleusine coracana subsp. coracana]|uniref:Uncharacterized protein n=1 Tax=Eleusine coracana subsp. coracana TaxID=191504 RepID=A0AAV5FIA7_ELECO|nr:hypothetical protein PR202_gb24271 [Eleusine coracana subsp. coracana]